MKQCISCGKDIPDEASICLFCGASQVEKNVPEIPVPKKRRPVIIGILAAAAAVIIIVAVLFATAPKTYETGTASVSWPVGNTSWKVLLRNTAIDNFHWKTPQDSYERYLLKGESAAMPLQLYVYDENTGENAMDAFMEALKDSSLTSNPSEGSQAMECSEPSRKDGFPDAVLVSDVLYDTNCVKNDVEWKLNMNNGDTLILHESVDIGIRPEASYSYETTPLETAEELQALIDNVEEELSPVAAVTITLAPVVYEGDISLTGRQISLVGTQEGDKRTTITGKLTLEAAGHTDISLPDYHGILFEGENAGIEATETFFASECEFSGCNAGVTANEGCWAMPYDCAFTDCGTALLSSSVIQQDRNAHYHTLFPYTSIRHT